MSSSEERAAELARDIELARRYAPTAEVLAELSAKSDILMASGLIWTPDPDFLENLIANARQERVLEPLTLL